MKKTLSQLIPFGVAVTLVIIHVIQVLLLNINPNEENTSHYIIEPVQYASMGLIITFILVILKKSSWKYVFLVLILLSFTGLIKFYNRSFSFEIGILNINLISLAFLVFHLAMNPDIISKIRLKLEPSEENLKKEEELKLQQYENNVCGFEKRFKSKQKNELEDIVNEKTLVPEAVEAARRLLKKQ